MRGRINTVSHTQLTGLSLTHLLPTIPRKQQHESGEECRQADIDQEAVIKAITTTVGLWWADRDYQV